jgi:DNA gyrase subunit B
MRKLIDEEHIYVAVPPIYKVSSKKDYIYLYDENKLKEGLKKFMDDYSITDQTKVKVQRFKGLGEMNPEELWETTMDPTKRRLLLVKYEDFINADNIFSILMGDEVEPRRKYILDHYHEVLNLDI